jgi:hypothetical protein
LALDLKVDMEGGREGGRVGGREGGGREEGGAGKPVDLAIRVGIGMRGREEVHRTLMGR